MDVERPLVNGRMAALPRTDRDIRNEVAVHHVDMDPVAPAASIARISSLFGEISERIEGAITSRRGIQASRRRSGGARRAPGNA